MHRSRIIRKQVLFITIAIVILGQVSLSQEQGRSEDAKPSLQCIDTATGKTIFDITDIVRFDWDRQVFELTRNSAMDVLALQASLSRKFILKSGKEIIYEGSFVSPLSSIAYQVPVIVFDWREDNIRPPLFKIDNGYPSSFGDSDPRFSQRLKEELEKAGVLGEIDPDNPPAPIQKESFGWFGREDHLRVWVDTFPDIFQIGRLARIHLSLTDARYLAESQHVVEVNLTLAANDGKFKYSAKRIFTEHGEGLKSIYVVAFNPWGLAEGCEEKIAKEGPAQIEMEISTRKVLDEKTLKYSEPIETVKTGPIDVTILPPKKSEIAEEAKAVMVSFQNALKEADWQGAISFCSEKVKDESKKYESPVSFVKEFVPVDKILPLSEFQTWGGSFGRDKQQVSFFCFVSLTNPDVRPVINWDWKIEKEKGGWVIDFKPTPLRAWIESETLRLETENQKGEQLKRSLKLELVALNEEYVIGKPILFRLDVTNVSESPITYRTSSIVMDYNPMVIKDSKGDTVFYTGGDCQTGAMEKTIQPNETLTLCDKYDATSQYHIVKPGRYTFQSKILPYGTSNIVEIDVKTGESFAEDAVAEKILSVLPAGWQLTKVTRRAGESLSQRFFIYLTGWRGRKGASAAEGGKGVRLLIFVNPAQSDLERYQFDGQLWGRSIWGAVYVRSFDAELLWPDYKEQIIRALGIAVSQEP